MRYLPTHCVSWLRIAFHLNFITFEAMCKHGFFTRYLFSLSILLYLLSYFSFSVLHFCFILFFLLLSSFLHFFTFLLVLFLLLFLPLLSILFSLHYFMKFSSFLASSSIHTFLYHLPFPLLSFFLLTHYPFSPPFLLFLFSKSSHY